MIQCLAINNNNIFHSRTASSLMFPSCYRGIIRSVICTIGLPLDYRWRLQFMGLSPVTASTSVVWSRWDRVINCSATVEPAGACHYIMLLHVPCRLLESFSWTYCYLHRSIIIGIDLLDDVLHINHSALSQMWFDGKSSVIVPCHFGVLGISLAFAMFTLLGCHLCGLLK